MIEWIVGQNLEACGRCHCFPLVRTDRLVIADCAKGQTSEKNVELAQANSVTCHIGKPFYT